MDKAIRKRANAAFAKVVKAAGGYTALAGELGCTKQNLHITFTMGRGLPKKYVDQVSAKYGFTKHDLRPDLFPLICGLCERRADDAATKSCTHSDCGLAERHAA